MDLVSGRPYWPARDGPMPAFPPLDHHVECDVAIVGGGMSGALIAYYLTDVGVDTLVVDRREIGAGSTSASTALIEYQLDADLWRLIGIFGEDAAVRSYRLCRDAVLELQRIAGTLEGDCEFEPKVGLCIASRKKDILTLKRELTTRARHGFDVDLINTKELERRYSITAPAALVYHPAAHVNPYRLTRELLLTSSRRGSRIFAHTEVTRIEPGVLRTVLITGNRRRITARRVIFAPGYEMLPHLPRSLADLKTTYALVSGPQGQLPGGVDECVITETLRPYLYTRTTADRRIMIGGEDENFIDPGLRKQHIPNKSRALLGKLRRWFPNLNVEAEYAWAGAFAATKDGLGYVDFNPRYRNVYYALGTGGNGMVFIVVAAQILRDLCTGTGNEDLTLFRFDRRAK